MHTLKMTLKAILWPFRFWRILLAGVLLLAAVHTVVDQALLRKLAAQTAQIRAEGRPVTFADLDLPAYTTIDNAQVLYEQAYEGVKNDEKYNLINRYLHNRGDAPLSDAERADVGNHLDQLQPMFDLLHRGTGCKVCIFPDFCTQAGAEKLSSCPNIRKLVQYTAAKAMRESEKNNIAGAFDWLAVGLNIAGNLKAYPNLLGCITKIDSENTLFQTTERILNDADLPGVPPAAFLTELGKCSDRKAYAWFFECERLYSNESPLADTRRYWHFWRPLFTLNWLKTIDIELRIADALRSEDVLKQRQTLDTLKSWAKNAPDVYFLPKTVAPAMVKTAETVCNEAATVALADAAIKLKQYKKDHGQYPESLDNLSTPAALDPFSGRPFEYTRDNDGFRLASAGKTGENKDDTKANDQLDWCAAK